MMLIPIKDSRGLTITLANRGAQSDSNKDSASVGTSRLTSLFSPRSIEFYPVDARDPESRLDFPAPSFPSPVLRNTHVLGDLVDELLRTSNGELPVSRVRNKSHSPPAGPAA